MDILFFNFILYTIAFLIYYKREHFTLYTFLWLEYAILSILGYYTVKMEIYTIGNIDPYKLSIIPYVLCFVFMWILFLPFKSLKLKNIQIPFSHKFEKFVYVWAFISILFLALKFSEALITISMGFGEAYENRHVLGESLFDYSGNLLLKRINFLGNLFVSTINPFVIFYCIQQLREGKKNKIIYSLLILAFLPGIIAGVGAASRGLIFSAFVKILFYVILFKDYVSEKVKRIAVKLFGVILCVMVFYSFAITTERLAGKNVNAYDNILRYFGECFPNLGDIFWDNVREHPMGVRLFPELLGINLSNYWDSADTQFAYWTSITGVPMLLFKTIFGDLYIEFGIFGAFVFAIILCILIKWLIKDGLSYYNISFLAYYFQIVFMGFAAFTGFGGFNNTIIAVMIIVNICLKKYHKKFTN